MTARLLPARQWLGDLDADGALRGQGADPERVRARSPRLVAIAERAVRDGTALLDPRVSCRILQKRSRTPDGIELEGGATLTGPLVVRRLWRASAVALLVATIGPRLENRVSRLFGRDLPYALALDGLGSAAVERLARAARRHLARGLRRRGWCATGPLSPGMEGWPLAAGQKELFRALEAPACGVRLTDEDFLVPRKSLSLVVGLGAGVDGEGEACDACAARPRCRHRSSDGPPA